VFQNASNFEYFLSGWHRKWQCRKVLFLIPGENNLLQQSQIKHCEDETAGVESLQIDNAHEN